MPDLKKVRPELPDIVLSVETHIAPGRSPKPTPCRESRLPGIAWVKEVRRLLSAA